MAPQPDSRYRDECTVELVLADGCERTITVEPGTTVVDAAETADIAVPFGCLYGVCGTCTARVLAGEIEHTAPPRGLKTAARDEGFVLPCIGTPKTDCRLRVGHDIQAEAMGTPWK